MIAVHVQLVLNAEDRPKVPVQMVINAQLAHQIQQVILRSQEKPQL